MLVAAAEPVGDPVLVLQAAEPARHPGAAAAKANTVKLGLGIGAVNRS